MQVKEELTKTSFSAVFDNYNLLTITIHYIFNPCPINTSII